MSKTIEEKAAEYAAKIKIKGRTAAQLDGYNAFRWAIDLNDRTNREKAYIQGARDQFVEDVALMRGFVDRHVEDAITENGLDKEKLMDILERMFGIKDCFEGKAPFSGEYARGQQTKKEEEEE